VPGEQQGRDRWRRYWDNESASYDKQMRFFDRYLFADTRAWVCAQAAGRTLEVAVGTGLNLPFYPSEADLTAVDFSPAMLAVARRRAGQLGRAGAYRPGVCPPAAPCLRFWCPPGPSISAGPAPAPDTGTWPQPPHRR
jgi:SAM-dependent methyltransferase